MKQIQKNPQESDRNVIGEKKDNLFKAIIYLRASSFDLWFTFQEHIPVLKLQAAGPRTRAHPLHSPQFHMTTGKPQNPSVPRRQSQTQRTAAVFTGIEQALPQKAGPRKPSASTPEAQSYSSFYSYELISLSPEIHTWQKWYHLAQG